MAWTKPAPVKMPKKVTRAPYISKNLTKKYTAPTPMKSVKKYTPPPPRKTTSYTKPSKKVAKKGGVTFMSIAKNFMLEIAGLARFFGAIYLKSGEDKESPDGKLTTNFREIDKDMEIDAKAKKHGLEYKEHTVTTTDGYILTVMEIFKKGVSPNAEVVLLQHGLYNSAYCWTFMGADSIPFYMAKKGFRVFMGNNRGSQYSTLHTKYKPTKNDKLKTSDHPAYFDFSFYELGKFDAPAEIDLILKLTNKKKITFVGYSQGAS